MWKEIAPPKSAAWPKGIRVPIVMSVHHQSEEAAVKFEDGRPDPFDFSERQYGGRRGAWRLLELLDDYKIKGTWIICGATAEKYPQITREVIKAGHSLAGHTYEHEMMCNYPAEEELELIRRTVGAFEDVAGVSIRGWRTCFASYNTLDLLLEHFDFAWDASIWNDDLPYIIEGHGKRLLEIPFSAYGDASLAVQITNPAPATPYCTWHTNTPRFIFNTLKAQFDSLYERSETHPVLMPLSVHDFIMGRPSRTKALDDFIRYAKQFDGVEFITHDQICDYWQKNYQINGSADATAAF